MSDERTHVDEQRPTGPNGPTDLRSTLRILGQVADDVGTLARKEIQLARQEITEGAIAKAKAGAAFAFAAVLGLFFVGFAAAAGAAKLAERMEAWQAILIVAAVFLMMALVAARRWLHGRFIIWSRTFTAPIMSKPSARPGHRVTPLL